MEINCITVILVIWFAGWVNQTYEQMTRRSRDVKTFRSTAHIKKQTTQSMTKKKRPKNLLLRGKSGRSTAVNTRRKEIEEVEASCNFPLLNLLKAGELLSISSEFLSVVSVFFSEGREDFSNSILVEFFSDLVLYLIEWAIIALTRVSVVASSLLECLLFVLSQVLALKNFSLVCILVYLLAPSSQPLAVKNSALFFEDFLLKVLLLSSVLLRSFWNPKVSQFLRVVLCSKFEEIMEGSEEYMAGALGDAEDSKTGKKKSKLSELGEKREKRVQFETEMGLDWGVDAWENLGSVAKASNSGDGGLFGNQFGMWMRMNMPLAGTPGAPLFKGPNVSRFTKVVEGLFRRHFVISDREKLDYLADYCSDSISIWLTSLVEFDLGLYEKVVERLKSEYAGQDEMLKKFNLHWLQKYKEITRDDPSDLHDFLRTFHFVSENMIKRKLMSPYLRAAWLLEGLPEFLQIKLIEDLCLDLNKEDSMNYERIRSAVQSFLRLNKTFQYVRSGTSARDVLDPMRKEGIDDEPRNSILVQPDGSYPKPEQKKAKEQFYSKTAGGWQVPQESVQELTEKIAKLEISLAEMEKKEGKRPVVTMSPYTNRRFPHPADEIPSTPRRPNWIDLGENQCRYCREIGHIRRGCPHLQSHLAQSFVHLDSKGMVCWGASETDGGPMRFDDGGKSMKQQVEEQNRGLSSNFMEFNFDSVRFADATEDRSTDEETEIRVSAAKEGRVVKHPEPMSRQQRAKLKAALDREEGLPAVKTQRRGKYKAPEVTEDLEMSSDDEDTGPGESSKQMPVVKLPKVLNRRAVQEEKGGELKDEKLKSKVEKIKKIKIADELKGKTDPSVLIDRVLDQQVEVSLRELIGVSPSIHKTFFAPFEPSMRVTAQFAEGELPECMVNSIVSVSNIEDEDAGEYPSDEEVLYTVGTMKAWVQFGRNPEPIKALLDGGSEINLMHRAIADFYRLPITLHCGGEMRSAECGRTPFAGICEKTPMKIASFEYEVPFFVINHQLSHPLMLGRPFEHMARMRYTPNHDGSVDVTLISRDRQQQLVLQVFSSHDSKNQTRNQIFRPRGRILEEFEDEK